MSINWSIAFGLWTSVYFVSIEPNSLLKKSSFRLCKNQRKQIKKTRLPFKQKISDETLFSDTN